MKLKLFTLALALSLTAFATALAQEPTKPQPEPQTPPTQTEPQTRPTQTEPQTQPQTPQRPDPQTAEVPTAATDTSARKNIAETAMTADNFKTLSKAIEAAGLADTLKSGNYTVFAPTDEAFAKLPAGALDALLADKAKLKKVLLYHVVEGNVSSSQVSTMTTAKSVQGATLKIKAKDGKVMVDKATVIQPDIAASNGTIHAIDTVLMP